MIERSLKTTLLDHVVTLSRTAGPVALLYAGVIVWFVISGRAGHAPVDDTALSEAAAVELVKNHVRGNATRETPLKETLRCGPNMNRAELTTLLRETRVPAEARPHFAGDWLVYIQSDQDADSKTPIKPWTRFGAVFVVKGRAVWQVMGFMILDNHEDWRPRFRQMLATRYAVGNLPSAADMVEHSDSRHQ